MTDSFESRKVTRDEIADFICGREVTEPVKRRMQEELADSTSEASRYLAAVNADAVNALNVDLDEIIQVVSGHESDEITEEAKSETGGHNPCLEALDRLRSRYEATLAHRKKAKRMITRNCHKKSQGTFR